MNQFLRLFSWSKIIFKVQSYGHCSDSSSISHFFSSSSILTGYDTSLYAQLHTIMHVIWWWVKLYCVLQAFPCATQPHVMATMSALGPADAWEIASTRSPPFIAKPDEHRSSGGSPANEDYNIMARRICINRFWLVGNKAIILIDFPLLYMYRWCQSSAVDANWHTDKRLCSFHEISMSCTNIAK